MRICLIFIFSLFCISSFARAPKAKCAYIIADVVDLNFLGTKLDVKAGGELSAPEYCGEVNGFKERCRMSKETTANSINFERRLSDGFQLIPNRFDIINVALDGERYSAFSGASQGRDRMGDQVDYFKFEGKLDQDCNLQTHYLDIHREPGIRFVWIEYDRNTCLKALQLFTDSKLSLQSLIGNSNSSFGKKVEAMMKETEKNLSKEKKEDVSFRQLYTYEFINRCTRQMSKEAEYDGRLTKAYLESTEWVVETYKNVTAKASKGAAQPKAKTGAQ